MTKRVLVVDDDALLGLEIAQQLTDVGLEVVGPAISVARALRLMGERVCDAAVSGCEPWQRDGRAHCAGIAGATYPFCRAIGLFKRAAPAQLSRCAAVVKASSAGGACRHAAQMHASAFAAAARGTGSYFACRR